MKKYKLCLVHLLVIVPGSTPEEVLSVKGIFYFL